MISVEPKLSSDPLRSRREGEPWLDWARELLSHTLAERAMARTEWERHFGLSHPGDWYARTLEAQEKKLMEQIEAVESAGRKNS